VCRTPPLTFVATDVIVNDFVADDPEALLRDPSTDLLMAPLFFTEFSLHNGQKTFINAL
jgi:hypothetical protein